MTSTEMQNLEKKDSHSSYFYCFDIHNSQRAEDKYYLKKKDQAKKTFHIFFIQIKMTSYLPAELNLC